MEITKWAMLLDWEKIGRPPFSARSELMKTQMRLRHGLALAASPDKPDKIEGLHADHILVLLDEAKIIPPQIFDSIEGAFSGAGEGSELEAYALAISTPGEPAGRFYDIHTRKPGLEDWHVRHVTLAEAVAARRMTYDWADKRKALWGENSALFQNHVMGEFCADDEDAVIPLRWVEAAFERWRDWEKDGKPDQDGLKSVGVDVARSGMDKTVAAIRHGDVITRIEAWAKADTMETTGRVKGIMEAETGATAIVDVIGIGAGVYDRLREQGISADPFNAGRKTTQKDKTGQFGYFNLRSQGWWNLRQLLEPPHSKLALPPDDELAGDLTALHYTHTSDGKIRVEGKDDIRKRIGRSTDRGDACLAAGTLVATATGSVPIEQVAPGMLVWTRAGLRPVLASGCTARNAALITAELEDGRTITGTPDHPVWDGTAFRPLDEFMQADRMYVCELSASTIAESSSPATLTAPGGTSASITGRPRASATRMASRRSMSRSTRRKSAPFRTGGTFITRTRNLSTTARRTLRRFPRLSTPPTMRTSTTGTAAGSQRSSTGCGSLPRSGTGHPKGWRGTLSMAAGRGRGARRFPSGPVSAAVPKSRHTARARTTAAIAGVPATASRSGRTTRGATFTTRPARSAAPRSGPAPGPGFAAVRVARVREGGTGDVWNLAIAGQPEYFANGILVHNCMQSFFLSAGSWHDAYQTTVCPSCTRPFLREAGGKPRTECPFCKTKLDEMEDEAA